MREIKFRGKHHSGEWVYGIPAHHSEIMFETIEFKYISQFFGYRKLGRTTVSVNPETVGQFTGLKDRNGGEIYEGDVVNKGGNVYIVKWNQLHCCFGLYTLSGYVMGIVADIRDKKGNTPKEWMCSDLEIIGNIHENKDL